LPHEKRSLFRINTLDPSHNATSLRLALYHRFLTSKYTMLLGCRVPSARRDKRVHGFRLCLDLKEFTEQIGIPSARFLRKDELDQAVKHPLRTAQPKSFAKRPITKSAPRHIDLGSSTRPSGRPLHEQPSDQGFH